MSHRFRMSNPTRILPCVSPSHFLHRRRCQFRCPRCPRFLVPPWSSLRFRRPLPLRRLSRCCPRSPRCRLWGFHRCRAPRLKQMFHPTRESQFLPWPPRLCFRPRHRRLLKCRPRRLCHHPRHHPWRHRRQRLPRRCSRPCPRRRPRCFRRRPCLRSRCFRRPPCLRSRCSRRRPRPRPRCSRRHCCLPWLQIHRHPNPGQHPQMEAGRPCLCRSSRCQQPVSGSRHWANCRRPGGVRSRLRESPLSHPWPLSSDRSR
jgi:hypothetical protein